MTVKTQEYTCIHEEQLQDHSRKLERLDAAAQYREQKTDELNTKISEMDKKLDKVLDGFNELKIKSHNDDKELELRLATIEARLEAQDKSIKDNRARNNQYIAIMGFIIAAITFYFDFLH